MLPNGNLYGAEVNRAFVLGRHCGWLEVLCSPAARGSAFRQRASAPWCSRDRVEEAGFAFTSATTGLSLFVNQRGRRRPTIATAGHRRR